MPVDYRKLADEARAEKAAPIDYEALAQQARDETKPFPVVGDDQTSALHRLLKGAVSELVGTQNTPLNPDVEKNLTYPSTGPIIPRIGASLIEPSIKNIVGQAVSGNYAGATGAALADVVTFGIPEIFGRLLGKTKKPVAEALAKSAQKNYVSTLLPTRKAAVPAAESTASKMAENKILASSRNALQKKSQEGMSKWGPQAGKAFESANPVTFDEAFNAIEKLKDENLYVKGTKTVPENRQGLQKFFDGAQSDLMNLADEQGNIPAQILDNYVDDVNKGLVGANQNYRTNLAPKTVKKMEQSTARQLRIILDTPNPKAAKINSLYSMYARINQFTEESRRAQITAKSAVVTGSSKGFGALVERALPRPIRELPRKITGVFDSVPWNTLSGTTKQTIADYLSRGDWDKALNAIRIGTGMSILGRNATRNPQTQNAI
jgi:hypothetical protein